MTFYDPADQEILLKEEAKSISPGYPGLSYGDMLISGWVSIWTQAGWFLEHLGRGGGLSSCLYTFTKYFLYDFYFYYPSVCDVPQRISPITEVVWYSFLLIPINLFAKACDLTFLFLFLFFYSQWTFQAQHHPCNVKLAVATRNKPLDV